MAHVMVCGLGEVGYQVVSLLLDLGEQVTVVTLAAREEWLNTIKERGAKVFIGDARNEKFLVQAGLADMDAILACVHNDGTNIEIALDVQRICPEKRTIARIVDPGLARHSEKHLKVHRAIAMTRSAAPTFAAATFGDSVLTELKVNHQRYLALQVEGPRTLSEKPLVAIAANGECLFHDRKDIKEGESAVILSHPDALFENAPKKQQTHSLIKALSPTTVLKFMHNVWTNASVQLRAVLIAIFAVVIISVVVFQYGMKLSLIDSIYFTITTATTTGYGDISPKDSASWVKVYTCFMMVICSAGLAVLFSVVTDYILTARMLQMRGHHHVPERGHVIVVGVGTVGFRTVEELIRLKSPVVAVEQNEDGPYLSHIRAKTHVVIGDGREPETLIRAGVEHAKAIVALTPSDAANLGIGLTAKELNPDIRVVLSIFDADFATKVASIAEIDAALSAPVLAAPSFVGAALYEKAVASFVLGDTFFILCSDPEGTITVANQPMTLETRKLK